MLVARRQPEKPRFVHTRTIHLPLLLNMALLLIFNPTSRLQTNVHSNTFEKINENLKILSHVGRHSSHARVLIDRISEDLVLVSLDISAL